MGRIGILVVDDHPLFRRGIRAGLESERDLLVVAEAADGPAALHATEQFAPDVVLLDISLPSMSGFDVARAIKRRQPRAVVVILTMHEDDGHLFAAIRSGADVFAAKSIEMRELVRLIRHVTANDAAASPGFASAQLLDEVRSGIRRAAIEDDDYSPLSPREIEILGFVAQGQSNKEIASTLRISDQTVKNNITSILRKLQVNDRTQAVIYALRHGWIDLGSEEAG
ncbi:MAG: response regulator transcription factor [Thermomicrobiales bacterium]|nr:response regulator transcription factor [Thermomicrobiales bacterium]